jgi:hypothetical protein
MSSPQTSRAGHLPTLEDADPWRRAAATLRSSLQTETKIDPPTAILTIERENCGPLRYGIDFSSYDDEAPQSLWAAINAAEERATRILDILHPIGAGTIQDSLASFSLEVARTDIPKLSRHLSLLELRHLETRLLAAGEDRALISSLLHGPPEARR